MFVIKKTPLIINSYFCTLELRIYNNKTLITMVKKIMENKVEEEEKGEAQQLKKRKGKDVFPFGNYKNYYGYRVISFFLFFFFLILILIFKANYINKC